MRGSQHGKGTESDATLRLDYAHPDADRRAVARALITRLRAAEREASSAGMLRCKLTHAEAQIEAAERALEDVAPGLLAEHAPVFGAILELGARLRAAESALPSAAEVYAIEEARAAIESSCDVYCDEIDAWLSRVGEARAVQHGSEGLRAAEARTAWQPIETAPVGVEVMVTWVDRQGLRHMSGGILLGPHWWTHGRVVTPTHWQPLPAPPASEVSRD